MSDALPPIRPRRILRIKSTTPANLQGGRVLTGRDLMVEVVDEYGRSHGMLACHEIHITCRGRDGKVMATCEVEVAELNVTAEAMGPVAGHEP